MLAGLQPDASGGGARSLSACFCDFCGTGVFQCGVFPCFPQIALKCVCVCVCVCVCGGPGQALHRRRLLQVSTHWKAFDEINKIDTLLDRSALNISRCSHYFAV